MASSVKKRIFFTVFCLASVTQGMYSTYFVSILTTIERIYQIQSKTAGAIMSATEIGQILGSLLIAYYGGRGNKPKWIAACMTMTAIAALISTSPHFLLLTTNSNHHNHHLNYHQQHPVDAPLLTPPYLANSDLRNGTGSSFTQFHSTSSLSQLCYLDNAEPTVMNSTHNADLQTEPLMANSRQKHQQQLGLLNGSALVIFFLCLLAIGFGSTAITTLGIPFIDDIVSKEESPLYLGLTIGLRIFGPALGFLLGSFCIRIDVNLISLSTHHNNNMNLGSSSSSDLMNSPYMSPAQELDGVGAWWLGLIIISLPLLILAFPMYYLSLHVSSSPNNEHCDNEFEDITYQAAEDHDIGESTDFQPHVLAIHDLDVTSSRTYYSDVDSSSREVLARENAAARSSQQFCHYNFGKNITLEQPIITKESILSNKETNQKKTQTANDHGWHSSCMVVNQFGDILESTSFTNDEAKSLHSSYSPSSSSPPPPSSSNVTKQSASSATMNNLSSTLSRLIKNKLLLLRMLSKILHILPVAGFYTFFPKYLIEQFRIAPSSANAISGLAGILFVGLGAFLGGTIIRLLNVNSRLMTRWIAISSLLYCLGMLILMNLGCPQNQIVYYGSDEFTSTDCLTNCRCSADTYNPVCANGTTYMSPCLAGCKNSYTISKDKVIYDECGCSASSDFNENNINQQLLQANETKSTLSQTTDGPAKRTARLNLNVADQGNCLFHCDNLKWYIVIFSIFTLIHASSEVGSMMFDLRCVKSTDRTLALGLITFTSSLLGTIPCSVIYGTVIDLTCIHWDTLIVPADNISDGSNLSANIGSVAHLKGSCRAYKNDTFRYHLHGVTALVMFLAFLVDCIVSRRSKEVDFYGREKSQSKEQVSVGLKSQSTETI